MPDQTETEVTFHSSAPQTVLPDQPEIAVRRLEEALSQPLPRRRDAVADVAASFPRYLEAWAELGGLGRDEVESYAYYRVGYHRGLDALRGAGWRGVGQVRWESPSNRGFLRCLDGLRQSAAALGETDEEARCSEFLRQLDPKWSPGA